MRGSAGTLALAACALRTSAFLLPPGFTVASEHHKDFAISAQTFHAKSHALTLPCSECVFPARKGDLHEEAEDDAYRIQGGANSVLLNYSISEDGKRLEFNGNPMFPLEMVWKGVNKEYVKQVASSATLDDIKTGDIRYATLEVTGEGFGIQDEEVVTPEGDTLTSVRHVIFDLEGQSVSLDAVIINLLKTPTGELHLLHVETETREPPMPEEPSPAPHGDLFDVPPPPPHRHMGPPPPPHHPMGPHHECKVLPPALCSLRNMIEAKIFGPKHGGMKHGGKKTPCPGFKVKGGPSRFLNGMTGVSPHDSDDRIPPGHPPFPHGRPHHPRHHHGHHHHHHRHHGFLESLSRGLAAVLVPTLAGIAVGMMVSLLGLVVGRVIGYLWIKLYRGGRRGYASVALEESNVEAADAEKDVDETKGEKDDELPAYERPPAYDDESAPKEEK